MDSHPNGDTDLPRLLEELENADDSVRKRAALELSKVNLEPMTAVVAYLRLLADSESEIRGIAAAALGSLGPLAKESVTQLRRVIQDDWSDEVRIAAAKALWKIDDRTTEESIQSLVSVVMKQGHCESCEAAAALSEIGLPAKAAIDGLVEHLVESFENDSEDHSSKIDTIYLMKELGGCNVEQLHRLILVDQLAGHLQIAMNLVEHRPELPTEFILHFIEHTVNDDAHNHLLGILEGRNDWTPEQALPAFEQAIRSDLDHPQEPPNTWHCIKMLDQRSDCTAEHLLMLFAAHCVEIDNEWSILAAIERRLQAYPSSRLTELLTENHGSKVRAILDSELKKRDAPAVSP